MKLKLLSMHYIDDRLLDEGTIIGDDTDVLFRYPDGTPMGASTEMEGLDDEGREMCEKRKFPGLFADITPNQTERLGQRRNPDPKIPLMGNLVRK